MNLAVAESSFFILFFLSLYLSLFSLSSKLILLHTSACQILLAVGYHNKRPSTKQIVAAGWSVLSLPFCTTLAVVASARALDVDLFGVHGVPGPTLLLVLCVGYGPPLPRTGE